MRRAQPGAVPHDKPMALVSNGPRGVMITAVNAAALQSGVHAGQMLADARAVFPMLLTRAAETARDQQVLEHLALWLGRYGPARNTDGDDGLWGDITGVAHLFGGEAMLVRDCVERLQRAGFHALAAIADTRSGAYALARYGCMRDRIFIAPPGATKQALADLPMQGLQLTDDLVVLLRRLGLKQIGQLYQLPRAALARRFREACGKAVKGRRRRKDLVRPTAAATAGWAEALVMRLDQALGDLREPEPGIQEPPLYRVQRAYAEPLISNEGIIAALDELADQLCRKLERHGQGARWLRFTIFRADGSSSDVEIGTSRPAREAAHIIELFQPRLEHMDAGLGLDAIVLEALKSDTLCHEQTGFSSSAHDQGTALLIDRLANRLGGQAVFYLKDVASHIPERAQRRVMALRGELAFRPRETIRHPPSATHSFADFHRSLEHPLDRPLAARPTFLLTPPEPVRVVAAIPDGVPCQFTWRRVTRRITRAMGPERIAPEWWRLIGTAANASLAMTPPHHKIRDYYRIEDEHGGLYWIYRSGFHLTSQEASPERDERRDEQPDDRLPAGVSTAASPVWYLHGLF